MRSWEYVVSLDFEWSFFSGKRKLRWPFVRFLSTCSPPRLAHELESPDILFLRKILCSVDNNHSVSNPHSMRIHEGLMILV